MMKTAELKLVKEWDKTFPQSDKVDHSKVAFVNRYGITLAADMYITKKAEGRLPAIAVCGPFGAVKEQCSGLYAQTMAERASLPLLLIRPLPVKVEERRDTWLLLTSIQKISWQR